MLELLPWHQEQWNQLLKARSHSRLHHALLLTGPEGTGPGQFADCLAYRMLCESRIGVDVACGECRSCVLLSAGNHPDLLRVGPEEESRQIKVDAARDLIDYLQLSSHCGGLKVAIVSPAEGMNWNAANTMLKVLEEPPGDALILLVSQQPALLPATIRSRCQRISFPPVYDQTALDWLGERLKEGHEPGDLLMMARGEPLRVVAMLENDTFTLRYEILNDLKKKSDPVRLAEKWQSLDIQEVFSCLVMYFSRMGRLKSCRASTTGDQKGVTVELQELAKGLDLWQILSCFDLASRNYSLVTGPFNLSKQGLLEDFIIYWQNLTVATRGQVM